MKNLSRTLILAFSLALLFLIGWYFTFLLYYIGIAAILALTGRPLESWLRKLKIKNFGVPGWASASLTLIVLGLILSALMYGFTAIVIRQAGIVSAIDFHALEQTIEPLLIKTDALLASYGLLPSGEGLKTILTAKARDLVGFASFSGLVGNFIDMAGSLTAGVFSVFFLTFFFLRDHRVLNQGILLFVPYEYEQRVMDALAKIKHLLTRYFTGLFIEVISMMFLLGMGLWIAGIPNALLIGFLGGLFNVIPYLGPLIGAITGIALTTISGLSGGDWAGIPASAMYVGIVFIAANLIDNLLLQPMIYSKSVKAHPIEIFLVILMAGSLAGVQGMILAIPVYTVIRILGKEFLSGFDMMNKLTRNL